MTRWRAQQATSNSTRPTWHPAWQVVIRRAQWHPPVSLCRPIDRQTDTFSGHWSVWLVDIDTCFVCLVEASYYFPIRKDKHQLAQCNVTVGTANDPSSQVPHWHPILAPCQEPSLQVDRLACIAQLKTLVVPAHQALYANQRLHQKKMLHSNKNVKTVLSSKKVLTDLHCH